MQLSLARLVIFAKPSHLTLHLEAPKSSSQYSTDRSQKPANELVERIRLETNSTAIAVQCNLQTVEAPNQTVDAPTKAFGRFVDILINNAGDISDKFAQDITTQNFDEIFYLNVREALLMVQAVLPHLRTPGRIINIASVGGRGGYADTGTYAASKGPLGAIQETGQLNSVKMERP